MEQASRRIGWGMIALAYLVYLALTAGLLFLGFQARLFDPLNQMSDGLMNQTFQIALISLAVMSVVIFGFARLRPGDVGLVWSRVPSALGALVVFWLMAQVVLLMIGLVVSGGGRWSPGGGPAFPALIGALLAQLLASALTEEAFFRGFLLSQCFRLLSGLAQQPTRRALAALLGSQLLFALIHVPALLFRGYEGMPLAAQLVLFWLLGIEFALVYLVTRNLFIAVAVHGLGDAGVNLFAVPVDTSCVYALLAGVLLLTWVALLRVRKGGMWARACQDAAPVMQAEGEARSPGPPE